MDYSDKLELSYYKTIATINGSHKIYLVQHIESNKVYVRKELDIYSPGVYENLMRNPIEGIPRIIGCFENDAVLTIIEEYVPGNTLKELMDAGTLTASNIAGYMIKLCGILEKLHSHTPPLIHRDIKPSNIMITNFGNVALLDFNAAKYYSNDIRKSADTSLLGTPGYAAPEQYGFGESSPQTDIYSMGVLIKEAVSSLPETTDKFDAIISKCTMIDKNRRYSSARELKRALEKVESSFSDKTFSFSATIPFLPPGFRTLTPWKMALALIVYVSAASLCFTFKMENYQGLSLALTRIFCFAIFLFNVMLAFNYLDIQRLFPLYRGGNRIIKTAAVVLSMLVTTFLLFIILTILVTSLST